MTLQEGKREKRWEQAARIDYGDDDPAFLED